MALISLSRIFFLSSGMVMHMHLKLSLMSLKSPLMLSLDLLKMSCLLARSSLAASRLKCFFPFRLQWNLLQDGAPPALPRSAGAPAAAKEKTKSIKEDSVGYRKQVLTTSPALIRQQEDITSPLFKLVPRSFLVTRTTSLPCSRMTRGKSDSLRFLRSCHIKQDIDC